MRASVSLGPISGGVVLPKLSKMLNQEVALGAPWLLLGYPLSAGAVCCGRCNPSLLTSQYCVLHPSHHADKR